MRTDHALRRQVLISAPVLPGLSTDDSENLPFVSRCPSLCNKLERLWQPKVFSKLKAGTDSSRNGSCTKGVLSYRFGFCR
jgi:hypothetical protein